MTSTEPRADLDGRFSNPEAVATPWVDVDAALTGAELYWLTTVRADGRPHVAPLTALWVDGAFYFATGDEEQKAHNLTGNPQVAVTTGANKWTAGLDVVVEGTAATMAEADDLQGFADRMREKYSGGWDYQVVGEFVSPGGDTRARVYRVTPTKVLAFAKDPHAQTRYEFG